MTPAFRDFSCTLHLAEHSLFPRRGSNKSSGGNCGSQLFLPSNFQLDGYPHLKPRTTSLCPEKNTALNFLPLSSNSSPRSSFLFATRSEKIATGLLLAVMALRATRQANAPNCNVVWRSSSPVNSLHFHCAPLRVFETGRQMGDSPLSSCLFAESTFARWEKKTANASRK